MTCWCDDLYVFVPNSLNSNENWKNLQSVYFFGLAELYHQLVCYAKELERHTDSQRKVSMPRWVTVDNGTFRFLYHNNHI